MKTIRIVLILIFMFSPFGANATLTGDSVIFGHWSPDLGSQNLMLDNVLIQDSGSPEFSYPSLYTTDLFTKRVVMDSLLSEGWSPEACIGLNILDMDWVNEQDDLRDHGSRQLHLRHPLLSCMRSAAATFSVGVQ